MSYQTLLYRTLMLHRTFLRTSFAFKHMFNHKHIRNISWIKPAFYMNSNINNSDKNTLKCILTKTNLEKYLQHTLKTKFKINLTCWYPKAKLLYHMLNKKTPPNDNSRLIFIYLYSHQHHNNHVLVVERIWEHFPHRLTNLFQRHFDGKVPVVKRTVKTEEPDPSISTNATISLYSLTGSARLETAWGRVWRHKHLHLPGYQNWRHITRGIMCVGYLMTDFLRVCYDLELLPKVM